MDPNDNFKGTPKKPGKFSFSGFGKSNAVKPQIEQQPKEESKEEEKEYVGQIFIGKKVPYASNTILKLDENLRKVQNWNDIMFSNNSKNEEKKILQRQIEENNAIEQTIDLFGSSSSVSNNNSNLSINKKIDDIITRMNSYEVVNKKEKNMNGMILAPDFFQMLFEVFDFINPEERGKLLITIIFGGLMSKAKLSGIGGKSASNKFKDLTVSLNKLVKGGQNSATDRVYTKVTEIIRSQKLNKYRSDTTALDQVTNVMNLVNRLIDSKKSIYFPINYIHSDISSSKTVTLVGVPVIENLNDFFSVEQKVVSKAKKGNKDEDDYDDRYDSYYS